MPASKKKKEIKKEPPDESKPIWAFRHLDIGGPWDLCNAGEDLSDIRKFREAASCLESRYVQCRL